jgi:hypothetical protein
MAAHRTRYGGDGYGGDDSSIAADVLPDVGAGVFGRGGAGGKVAGIRGVSREDLAALEAQVQALLQQSKAVAAAAGVADEESADDDADVSDDAAVPPPPPPPPRGRVAKRQLFAATQTPVRGPSVAKLPPPVVRQVAAKKATTVMKASQDVESIHIMDAKWATEHHVWTGIQKVHKVTTDELNIMFDSGKLVRAPIEPDMTKDGVKKNCTNCHKQFGGFLSANRRSHCRKSGRLVCTGSECSEMKSITVGYIHYDVAFGTFFLFTHQFVTRVARTDLSPLVAAQ